MLKFKGHNPSNPNEESHEYPISRVIYTRDELRILAAAIKSKNPYAFLRTLGDKKEAVARFCPMTGEDPKVFLSDLPQVVEFFRICSHVYACMNLHRSKTPLPLQIYTIFVGSPDRPGSGAQAEWFIEEFVNVDLHKNTIKAAFAFFCRAGWTYKTTATYTCMPSPVTEWKDYPNLFHIAGWKYLAVARKTYSAVMQYVQHMLTTYRIYTTTTNHATSMDRTADLALLGKQLHAHFVEWAKKNKPKIVEFVSHPEMRKRRSFFMAFLRKMILPEMPNFRKIFLYKNPEVWIEVEEHEGEMELPMRKRGRPPAVPPSPRPRKILNQSL